VDAEAAKGDILLTAFGGAGIPSGDFGDYWTTGLILGARGDYMLSPAMSLGLNFAYLKNDPSDMYKEQMETFGIDSAKFTTIVVSGRFGYWFQTGGQFTPYIVVGLGLYNISEEYTMSSVTEKVSQSAFGGSLGAGANVQVNETIAINLEANYNTTSADEEEIGHKSTPFIDIRGGLTFIIAKKE